MLQKRNKVRPLCYSNVVHWGSISGSGFHRRLFCIEKRTQVNTGKAQHIKPQEKHSQLTNFSGSPQWKTLMSGQKSWDLSLVTFFEKVAKSSNTELNTEQSWDYTHHQTYNSSKLFVSNYDHNVLLPFFLLFV